MTVSAEIARLTPSLPGEQEALLRSTLDALSAHVAVLDATSRLV